MRQLRSAGSAPVARLGFDGDSDGRSWRDGDASTRHVPSTATPTWIALAGFCLLIAAHATGALGDTTYPVVTLAGSMCAVLGLRRHRPERQWPWWAMVATGGLWTVSGALGDAVGNTGDLTSQRSLLPDLLAIPGYLLFALALNGLLRARRAAHEPGALLDGIMLGAGALLLVNEWLISPTLDIEHSWLPARLVVAVYPALSMCLLVIAARLAFGGGDRSPAFRLLLIGTLGLLLGDVVYALGEIGRFDAPKRLLEVPYLLVPACIGSAVLHPSIRSVTRPTGRRGKPMGNGRLIAVAGALLAPIAVVAWRDDTAGAAATVGLCLVLAGSAITRLARAMREQAALETRLSHRATHDELTDLPSRARIVEHIEDLLADSAGSGRTIAVLFVDIDQFKLVNDSMGHSTGDQLLVLAARRLAEGVEGNGIVGRISGDEFIVVASLNGAEAFELGERIRVLLSRPFELDAGEVVIAGSIGISIARSGDPITAATLIQEADTAMYRSKDAGRNRVTLFDASMRERVARRVDLERRLRHALGEHQFEAHFQPLVALPSGRVQGFEALARWTDGAEQISPGEFIPVAEESGLIVPLGAFMLDEACRQLARWRRQLPGSQHLVLSVNLSPRQLREGDIVDVVAETLRRHRLPGDALWLEITESVMMEDSLTTAGALSGLRSLGVRLAVDDFGTGFSSLAYLKRFPVSCVKIDRSFVSGLGQHEADHSLVAAIIAMADALGLDTVAEGVETTEHAAQLRQLGCRRAQGFLFGRAVPAADVPELLGRLGIDTRAISHERRRSIA